MDSDGGGVGEIRCKLKTDNVTKDRKDSEEEGKEERNWDKRMVALLVT